MCRHDIQLFFIALINVIERKCKKKLTSYNPHFQLMNRHLSSSSKTHPLLIFISLRILSNIPEWAQGLCFWQLCFGSWLCVFRIPPLLCAFLHYIAKNSYVVLDFYLPQDLFVLGTRNSGKVTSFHMTAVQCSRLNSRSIIACLCLVAALRIASSECLSTSHLPLNAFPLWHQEILPALCRWGAERGLSMSSITVESVELGNKPRCEPPFRASNTKPFSLLQSITPKGNFKSSR